jgi:glycine/D-amino acid oxidase-like deaminating enzyme
MIFDIIIIGKGLIGSATAKHLSLSQRNLAIIGPDEPSDLEQALVFASHYDSGRVQRLIGHNDAMTQLNLLSVNHYPWLQAESGIKFHTGVGCLYVNPEGLDSYLKDAPLKAKQFGINASFYTSGKELADAFPEFKFPATSCGMLESSPSGHINPLLLIKAQLNVFEKNDGTVFRDTVTALEFTKGIAEVTTRKGDRYQARKIILATGAFSNFSGVLEKRLDLTTKSEVVILASVSKEEAFRLSTLPSLLYEIDIPEYEGIYSTQPIQYPDGNFYLKMGCNLPGDMYFGSDLREVQHWFRKGDSNRHLTKMKEALMTFMPNLKIEGCLSKRCILPRTKKHENPYIGQVHEGLYITTGNGWSAMCSDGAGQLMASLVINGKIPEGFNSGDFEPIFV